MNKIKSKITVKPGNSFSVYDVDCSAIIPLGGVQSEEDAKWVAGLVRQKLFRSDLSYLKHNALELDIGQIQKGQVSIEVTFLAVRATDEKAAEAKAKGNFTKLVQEIEQELERIPQDKQDKELDSAASDQVQ